MENSELQSLFDRYLKKEASPEEMKVLLDHFQMENETGYLKQMIYEQLEAESKASDIVDVNEDDVFRRVSSSLNNLIGKEQRPITIHFYKTAVFRAVASIAAVILFVSGSYFWNRSLPISIKTVYAAYGKQIEVHLPDSSKVWLNAGTTLQYPERFKPGARSVTLKDGEAFFEVTHDSRRPFTVSANGTDVSVLGTSFEISAFQKEADTKVTVSTGRVGILPAGVDRQAVFLLPGEGAVINRASHKILTIKTDTSDIAAWRHQQLIFTDQPVAEVLARLQRTYNVQFSIENDKVFHQQVTMRLKNQPLNNVLAAISFSNHLTFRKINEQIIAVR